MRVIVCLLLLIVGTQSISQKVVPYELEKTYWDKGKTKLRSIGYVNNNPYLSYFGAKEGEWKFYHKNGNIQEISYFNQGVYVNESTQFYPSGKKMIESFFYLGEKDSAYTSYFENGRIAEKGKYDKGIKTGVWEYWYVDSSLRMIARYDSLGRERVGSFWDKNKTQTIKNGNGKKISFFESGKIKEEFNYRDSLLEGEMKQLKASGNPLTLGMYKEGKKHGKWTTYFLLENQIHTEKQFVQDSLTGKYTKYFENGRVNISGEFLNNKKEGDWKWFDKQGGKDMEGQFVKDQQSGNWIYYYPSGKVRTKGSFLEGKKTGKWEFFYKNGRKHKEGTYKNDEKNGEWTVWFENKKMLHKGNFTNGKENGFWESWYENGEKKDAGTYKNGVFHGEWQGWYPNKNKRYEGSWDNNYKTGNWTYWHSNGIKKEEGKYKVIEVKRKKLKIEETIEKSVKHGKWNVMSEVDGSLVSTENFKNGKKHGKWTFYFPGGELISTQMKYKKGLLHGTFKSYDRSGRLMSEVNYKKNVKHGKTIIYDQNGTVVKQMEYKHGNRTDNKIKGYSPI